MSVLHAFFGGLPLTRREQVVSLVLAALVLVVFAWLVLVEVRP